MKKGTLIGKTIKGFAYTSKPNCTYVPLSMDKYIGVEGKIIYINSEGTWYDIKFPDGDNWSYPADEVEKQYELQNQPTIPLDELFKQISNYGR